jgi:excisionase family DNA binding protein
MFSLSQAAKRTGVSKATIHRAIKSGKLSALRQEDGSYQIDPAELHRVYPLGETAQGVSETGSVRQDATGAVAPGTPVLQAELTGARQLIGFLEAQAEDLRRDRDGWRQQAETAQRLLTDARPAAAAPPTPARPWWRRLAG